MAHPHGLTAEAQLLDVVRGVRNRWRTRHMLHGATIVAAGAFVLLVAASYVMELFRYAEPAVVASQIVAVLGIVALAIRFVALPAMSKAGDASVALYVEEHEPTLDGALVTAVEMQGSIENFVRELRSFHVSGQASGADVFEGT